MDLTTHCPQCATAFLVSEDQLELAQGWVRCGVCQEVFMAQAHTAAPVVQAVVQEEPLLHRQESMALVEAGAQSTVVSSNALADPVAVPISQQQSVSTPSKAHYRRASKGAIVILIGVLAAQLGFDLYRGLADSQPTFAFWLQSLCPPSRCALRQSSALGIDDSSLTSAGSNAFHLKAMISNRSGLTLEAPSLALTLTDAADEVLARKIYSPKEWVAGTEVLQGRSTASIDLWVQWSDATSTARVAGYRLQAFYP